ncbi:hypothetical protein [Treponema sp.]|uniref:hypothetical protein n=1 Tax=Treponema sp. TaxID=166 RepID=UPI0025D06466|nr:hypothetical protein [Treponema sp.]MCR5218032.1 hypothetical protein [Treponema sp.]
MIFFNTFKKAAIVCIFLLLSSQLYAATISSYSIKGLKHTKEDSLAPYLDTFIGKDSSEIDLHEIETTLRSYGIFSDVKVSLSEEENTTDGTVLNIELKEKITFLPIPFAFYSSTNYGGGLFILNSNAFGKKDTMMAGGMFLSNRIFGMFGYSHEANENSLGWTVFTSGGNADIEFTDSKDESFLEFSTVNYNATVSITEKLNSFCKLSQGVAYSYTHFKDDGYDDFHKISTAIAFAADFVDWNGYFMLTKALTISGGLEYYISDDFTQNAGLTYLMQDNFFTNRIRYIIDLKAKYEHNVPLTSSMEAGNEGGRILSEYFHTSKFAMGRFSLEAALLKKPLFTLSMLTSYECDLAEDYDDSLVVCHGPGCGFYLYLEKIALPALGFTYSYNLTEKYPTFNFSLGATF